MLELIYMSELMPPLLVGTEMDLITILAAKFAEEDCYRLLVMLQHHHP